MRTFKRFEEILYCCFGCFFFNLQDVKDLVESLASQPAVAWLRVAEVEWRDGNEQQWSGEGGSSAE